MRLKIAATVTALEPGEQMEFGRAKAVLGAPDGNLATCLAVLEKASDIAVEKDFVGKKLRTRLSLPREGCEAFERHAAYLKGLLEGWRHP